jgi:glutamate racemase
MHRPIGIFDSGVGGLTVMKDILRLLPQEDTIYVGDTARVPYGTRSARTVTQYALQIAEFLNSRNVKMLVVACNTSAAVAMNPLQERFKIPVIGVIEPGAACAAETTRNKKVGVIGTEATIRSEAYVEAIRRIDPQVELYLKSCPLFVSLAEEGWVDNEVARLTAEDYMGPLKNESVDTIILGCTHYPLFKRILGEIMGSGVTLVDSAAETAKRIPRILKEKNLLNPQKGVGSRHFYVTDNPEKFSRLSPAFLGEQITQITQISLP